MSSYVDLMSDVRWTEADHVQRVESNVRKSVTHTREHVLLRRTSALLFYVLSQMLPDGQQKQLLASFGQQLTPAALAELSAAAGAFMQADLLAEQARVDASRLDLALDYEEAQAALAALPVAPQGAADPDAGRREQLQAQIAAASQDTLDLVAQRATYRASQTLQAPAA